MPQRLLTLLAVVPLILLLAPGLPARAGSVAIINGASSSSEPGTTASITANLETLLQEAGNTTTVFDSVPADLWTFDQAWDIRFSDDDPISASEQTQYLAFLEAGGGMFVMGENDSFPTRNASVLSLVAAAGGGSLTFQAPTIEQSTQDVVPPFDGPNPIPSGTVSYSGPGAVTSTGSGQFVTVHDSGLGTGVAFRHGQLPNAPTGVLTAIFDVNFMVGADDQSASQQLLRNLISFVASPVLTPEVALNPVDTEHTLTARPRGTQGGPLVETLVTFRVISGPNANDQGTVTTDANGEAQFTYLGDGGSGADQIVATFLDETEEIVESNIALKFWDDDCNENGIPDTCDLSCGGFEGQCNVFTGCGSSDDRNQDSIPDECVPVGLIVHPPVEAGAWGEGIATSDNDGLVTVFLAAQDEGILIYQYTDPAEAETDPIATFTLDGDCSFVDLTLVDDDTLVAAAGLCGVPVIDVSIPSSPVLRGVFEAPTYAQDVAVLSFDGEGLEGVGYVADYFEGLWIVEATDPGAPLPLEFSETLIPIGTGLEGNPIAVNFSTDDGGTHVYVAHTQGLSIVDPDLAQVVGSCTTNPLGLDLDDMTAIPQDVAVGGDVAYVPIWMDGLLVMDVSVPSEIAGECSGELVETDQAYYKAIVLESGSHLFATEGQCGLAAFEITDLGLEKISSLPIAGGFDCLSAPPSSPLDESSAFAWGVHETYSGLAISWGRLDPREGGFQIVEVTEPRRDAIVAGSEQDEDADGVADSQDNCLETPNADQTDSDLDGFGNACDADYDGSGSVGIGDFSIFSAAYGAASSDDHYDARVDHNGDGGIGLLDYGVFTQRWGSPPGPSGLACAGSVPCP